MTRTNHAIALVPIVLAVLGACASPHPEVADPGTPDATPTSRPPTQQPNFGKVVVREESPPSISGGTLAMSPDLMFAVASDPDRDRVYIVDLGAGTLVHTVMLPKHSEPGRVSVDDLGRAYVALRRAGGLATIDLASGAFSVRDVCAAPRGVVFDKRQGLVHVACASGDVVSVPTGAGEMKRLTLGRDLRDVVMQSDGSMIVTRFRAASMIRVSEAGAVTLPNQDGSNLAWRAVGIATSPADGACTVPGCSDTTAMVVQMPTGEPVPTVPGGYGGIGGAPAGGDGFDGTACDVPLGIITTHVKLGNGSVMLPEAVLPVDLATNGRELAVIAAGNAFNDGLAQVLVVSAAAVRRAGGPCIPTVRGTVPGQAIAAAFDARDELVVQTREPAALHIMTADRRHASRTISLATDSVADTGHAIFHANSGGFIACASCHAEGADDGHVWSFEGIGARRTPSLLGTIAGTEPFHWDGDQKDLRDLVDHVFVERMSGPTIDDERLGALGTWLYAQPAPAKLRAQDDLTAAGGALFQERCTGCHAGPMLTNNTTVDVGTGGAFQVPSLVGVGWRPSLMHSGCAQTLAGRFDPTCGGDLHGKTRDLSTEQIGNLVQFLETL